MQEVCRVGNSNRVVAVKMQIRDIIVLFYILQENFGSLKTDENEALTEMKSPKEYVQFTGIKNIEKQLIFAL